MATSQPKNLVRRMTSVFKRSDGQQTPLPNYPTERCSEKPESFQLDLLAKWSGKNRPRNRKKKIRGILDDGHLELKDRSKTSTVGLSTIVDLARVTVKISERRVTIEFGPTKKVILTPADQKLDNKFKFLVKNQRLYRQELLCREKSAATSFATTASTITVSEDFRGWDVDPTYFKVLDAVKDMQQLTLEVLDRSTKCLAEMKAIIEEERTFLNMAAKPKTEPTKPVGEKPVSRPVTPKTEEEDEEESEELSEATERELFSARTTNLTSMEVARTEAEIQSKKDVLTRVQKVLDLPKPVTTTSMPPPPQQPEKIQKKTEETVKKMAKTRRTRLPAPQAPGESIGLKAVMQMAVSKQGVPMTQYEPLSLVQVVCEELFFANLLDQAVVVKSPEERMSLVMGFAAGAYLTKVGRNRKPFNPILGETFDFEEAGWKYHGEQVSHNPQVTAGHAEGKGWTFWSTLQVETSFGWGWSVTLKFEHPQRVRLILPDGTPEDYSWQRAQSKIDGLHSAPEQRCVSHEGQLVVQSSSRYTSRLYFKRLKKDPTEVTGDVFSPNDRVCYRLHGYWNKHLSRTSTTGVRETLISEKQLRRHPDYYGFNQLSMGLNEPDTNLPPSDSRHRLDMRQLEAGNCAAAGHYKQLLEAAQRTRKEPIQPIWFDLVTDEMTRKQVYITNKKYWPAKSRQFEGVKGMVETRCV